MPQRPKKPLEAILPTTNAYALDLINRLLIFAPHKRLTVEQCLVHPYVLQFHNPVEEPALNCDVTLPLPDHVQLSVQEYREKLYEMIVSKKTHIRRIQHNKPVKLSTQKEETNNNNVNVIQRPVSQPNNGNNIHNMKNRPMFNGYKSYETTPINPVQVQYRQRKGSMSSITPPELRSGDLPRSKSVVNQLAQKQTASYYNKVDSKYTRPRQQSLEKEELKK